jgi:hypothetical protein
MKQRKIPGNIKKMLDADDIELVQLGANLMREYVPKEKWESVLEMFSFREQNYLGYAGELHIKKWEWKIEGEEITISYRPQYDFGVINLWAMKQRINTPLLTMTNNDKNEIRLNSRTSKGYVGKPGPRNGKTWRSHTPTIRKK